MIHTADWHLGKIVNGVSMTEDQAMMLQRLCEQLEQERPDVLLLAGDLYDRQIPPSEAVDLLDQTFADITQRLRIPVLAIAGNHDSPSRLNFGTKLMEAAGLHLAADLLDDAEHPIPHVMLADEHGSVQIHLVPFADPSRVRQALGDATITTHDEAMAALMKRVRAAAVPSARQVVVAHAFVTPQGEAADNTSTSERALSVGGAEYVSARHFYGMDYVALGHLHRAHDVGNERIRYAGSPLKYSISEEHHVKGYSLVELGAKGQVKVTAKEIVARRDVRTVEGYMEELLLHPPSEDYVYVTLLDDGPVLAPMERVRTVYPHAMSVVRRSAMSRSGSNNAAPDVRRAELTPDELFRQFYEEMKGEAPSEASASVFKETLQAVERKDGIER